MTLILNKKAVEYAKNLIVIGKINRVIQPWQEIKPNSYKKSQFLKDYSIEEYSLWFLAETQQDSQNNILDPKVQYKFIFGNFKQVHKSALLEIYKQVQELQHEELKQVITELLELIDLSN